MLQGILLLWIPIILVPTSMAKNPSSIHGCQPKCGEIEVPYPFGIGDVKCSKNINFLLTCDTKSSNSPKLMYGNIQLLNISIEQGNAIAKIPAASTCNSKSINSSIDLEGTPFSISSTENVLTAIGCDSTAYIKRMDGVRIISTCTSLCDHRVSLRGRGDCAGLDCTQTQIPKGLQRFSIVIAMFNDQMNATEYSPCSYGFLADRNWTEFLGIDVFDVGNVMRDSQVVLDWIESNQTCESVHHENGKNSSSMGRNGCGFQANCKNNDRGFGYSCVCQSGYQGNPYLRDGCKDIDECSDPKAYPCHGNCTNVEGNYTCTCPTGKLGDGKMGCHRLRVVILLEGASIMIALLFVTGCVYCIYQGQMKRKIVKRKRNFFKRNGGYLLEQQIISNICNIEKTKVFTAKELEKATDHYNENRILGQGGQGTVYKGMLQDGQIVAVKKSGIIDKGHTEHFINEVAILSQINHRHIVKLLGCCLETEVPLLVYEFVSNGTLSNHLYDHTEQFKLTWLARLKIATEVAGALAYMHFAASIPIYHRDIKSTNILLDNKYEAKVSDFGISRSVPIEKTHLTTLVQGTLGYLDPEYFRSNQFTEKSDVYSFGVVLVELLTGRKPISSATEDERGLAAEFVSGVKEERLFDILDAQVVAEGDRSVLIAAADLAKRCLKLSRKKRPTMKEVASELERLRVLQHHIVVNERNQGIDCIITIQSDSELWDTSSNVSRDSSFD